jgi:hypothetical protein
MEKSPPVFFFLLFLEEFVQWVPGGVNTIVERLALIGFRSTEGFDYQLVTLLNPGVAAFLFLVSSGATVRFVRSLLTSWTSTDLILFINRHAIIRIVISGAIAFWLLQQILAVLSAGDVNRLTDLYQNKSFWTVLFIGMAAYQFTSPSI